MASTGVQVWRRARDEAIVPYHSHRATYGADAPSERHVRTPEGRPLAEGDHLVVQGKVEVISVYDREVRSVSISFKLPSVIRLLRYIRIKRRFDYVPFSRANIYARDDIRASTAGRRSRLPELTFDHLVPVAQGGRKDWENIVTCCITCNRKKGGRTPRRGRAAGHPHARRPTRAPTIRIMVGLRKHASELARLSLLERGARRLVSGRSEPVASPRALRDSFMPSTLSRTRITAVHPLWAVEGGRITLDGSDFTLSGGDSPEVRVGTGVARVVHASPTALSILVPPGLDGGHTAIRVEGTPGETAFIELGAPIATGLHQVDNPIIDRAGCLYVTYSGARGQQGRGLDFRVQPDGTRESFVSGITNPTSMTFDERGGSTSPAGSRGRCVPDRGGWKLRDGRGGFGCRVWARVRRRRINVRW